MTDPRASPPEVALRSPRRLEAVLALVPDEAQRVADIGYDHGKLLARLLAARPDVRAIGVERQAACAARFERRHAAEWPAWADRIALRTGDGLQPLSPGDADVVVMAGLGEPTILRVLARDPAVWRAAQRVVLCPSRYESALRPGLERLGLRIDDERVAWERGRAYEVIAASSGPPRGGDAVSRRFGPVLVGRRDPALRLIVAQLRRRQGEALRHQLAGHRRDGGPLSPIGEKLALLPDLEARMAAWWPEAPAAEPAPTA